MQITRSLTLKIIGVGFVETPASPVKEGMRVSLALVDAGGRPASRKSFTVRNGKILGDHLEDLGDAPASLSAALATAVTEIEKHVSALVDTGKLNF